MSTQYKHAAWRLCWTLVVIASCSCKHGESVAASHKSQTAQHVSSSETSYVEVNGARLHYQRHPHAR